MKRIAAYFIALVMCLGYINVFASESNDERFEQNTRKLAAFGITLEGNADDAVSRAEFIKKVLEFVSVDKNAYPAETVFSDVDKNYSYAQEINACYSLGYMIGYGDGKFYPESPVQYNQAVKVIVTALGYEQNALMSGGYPNGYLNTAYNIGLTDNAANAGEFDTMLFSELLLNACECIPQKVKLSGENVEIYEDKDNDALWEYHRIRKIKGVVDSNRITGLMSEKDAQRDGFVGISGETVSVGMTNAAELLGNRVSAYVYYPENEDEGEIKYIEADAKNTVITVSAKDIAYDDPEFSYYNFVYYNENERRKNTVITDDTAIIYNGIAMPRYTKEDLSPEVGNVRLIDNTGDGKADVIDIFDATKIIVVDYVTKRDNEITVTDRFDPGVSYKYDTDYELYDVLIDDEYSSYNAISENMLVLVGENGSYSKTLAYTGSFEGSIGALSEDEITIGDTVYKLPESFDRTRLKLGYDGTFWAYDGFILGFARNKISEYSYGYFVKPYFYENDSGEECLTLKILTEENEYKRLNTNEKTKYNGYRKDAKDALGIFRVPSTASEDRLKYPDIAAINEDVDKDGYIEQVVMYSLDENGEIKELYTQHSDGELKYNGFYSSTWHNNVYSFYNDSWMNKFYQDSETICFCVSNSDIEESYATVKVLPTDGEVIYGGYIHEMYNVTDEENTVDVVVWRKDTSGEGAKVAISDNIMPTIVKNVQTVLNADDEAVKTITGIQNGLTVSLEYNDKMPADVLQVYESIMPGDLVYYQKDANGRLLNISKSFDITKKGIYGISNQGLGDNVHSGWNNQIHMARKVAYFKIRKKLSNDFISYADDKGEVYIQKVDTSAKFYRMSVSGKNKVSVQEIEYKDIQTGDEVYCMMRYNKVKTIIVIDA